MSSIAYVSDPAMLEYHRLCRSQTILFWRLTVKNRFSDFHHGDLLFFYARGPRSRKKGFIGYGHYEGTRKLSLNQMWKQFGRMTGYDTKAQLEEAIAKASRNHIPESMQCLILSNIVFFTAPVFPKEVGLDIPANLESYCYIDKDDPSVTVRILKQADKFGIYLWSYDNRQSPETVFKADEVRHILAMACYRMGKETGSENEKIISHRLAREKTKEDGWELIRGSLSDCGSMDSHGIHLAIPFVCSSIDRPHRMQMWIGCAMLYALYLKQNKINDALSVSVLCETEDAEMERLVKQLNGQL